MQIKILKGVVVDRLPRKKGDILDCPSFIANYLINEGKAEEYIEKVKIQINNPIKTTKDVKEI